MLLSAEGDVLLADFGVAADTLPAESEEEKVRCRAQSAQHCPTRLCLLCPQKGKKTSEFAGSPCWMAPEVISQQSLAAAHNSRLDIWCLRRMHPCVNSERAVDKLAGRLAFSRSRWRLAARPMQICTLPSCGLMLAD